MEVKMTTDIQGFWADADGAQHEWPLHGETVTLPDDVASEVVRQGHAVEVADEVVPESPPPVAEAVVEEPEPEPAE